MIWTEIYFTVTNAIYTYAYFVQQPLRKIAKISVISNVSMKSGPKLEINHA